MRSERWDGEALVALVILWIASFIQCAGTVVRHEAFGRTATVALLAFLVASYLIGREIHGATRRRWRWSTARGRAARGRARR